MTNGQALTGNPLVLERRPMSPLFFYVVIVGFPIGYVTVLSKCSSNAQIAFAGWAAFLLLYCGVLGFWVDQAVIDRASGWAIARRGVGLLVAEKRFPLGRARFVSVAMASLTGSRFAYRIALWDGESDGEFRLVGPPHLENAWRRTVEIARYLNLPVRDRMIPGGHIWERGEVPPTVEERKARIASLPAPSGART